MLCDVIENAKYEKENIFTKGREEGLLEGIREGKLEGIREGELKAKLEMAKTLLGEGIPIEIVMKYTNLSKRQLDRIKLD